MGVPGKLEMNGGKSKTQVHNSTANLGHPAISLTMGVPGELEMNGGKSKTQVHNSTANLGHPATKRVVLTGCGEIVGSKESGISGEAEMV
jgi:hypothetical protein